MNQFDEQKPDQVLCSILYKNRNSFYTNEKIKNRKRSILIKG